MKSIKKNRKNDWLDIQLGRDEERSKFELYLLHHKISQILELMEKLASEDNLDQSDWFIEYVDYVNDYFEDFMDESVDILNEMTLDMESVRLSILLMTNISRVLAILQEFIF